MNIGNNVSTVRQHQEEYDFKITKRHFPRDNNDSILEFIFEKDPNLYMRKNKIVIRGKCFFLNSWCANTTAGTEQIS